MKVNRRQLRHIILNELFGKKKKDKVKEAMEKLVSEKPDKRALGTSDLPDPTMAPTEAEADARAKLAQKIGKSSISARVIKTDVSNGVFYAVVELN